MKREEIIDALTEAVRLGIVTELLIEFPRDTGMVSPGRVVVNGNEELLAGGGGPLRSPTAPHDIQIMRGKIECNLTKVDDWPRVLADALARLSAAVTLPKIYLEEGNEDERSTT